MKPTYQSRLGKRIRREKRRQRAIEIAGVTLFVLVQIAWMVAWFAVGYGLLALFVRLCG